MSAEEQVDKIRAILNEPWTPEMDDAYRVLRIRLALKLPDPGRAVMSPAASLYTDHYMVARIEEVLATRPTDHMLGLKVRLLFDAREDDRHKRADQPAATEERPPGVVELPDEHPVRWIDSGSGPGWIQKDEPRD